MSRGLQFPAIVCLAAALALTGCANTFDATTIGVPARLASAAGAPAVGDSFKVTRHAVYGFWGVFSLGKPSLPKTLASQLVDGKEIADLRIKVKSRFGDLLITGLTLGLIVPRSVEYQGVVVGGGQ